MEEDKILDDHLTSAAAFVEGGIQDACDDACSICLEVFSESEPSTVTACKHEFHLQCILEWCQRSSQCPMCWQPITLKDPHSQELLDAIERERSIRATPSRNTAIFHHPAFGDFELQHLPVGANDAELEDRIIQHLAAAAAMGRARHFARREGQRTRASAQGRPHFVVFSTNSNAPSATASSSPNERGEHETDSSNTISGSPLPLGTSEDSVQPNTLPHSVQSVQVSGSRVIPENQFGTSPYRSSSQSSPNGQDRAGTSEFQSFSESLKSRFNTISSRNCCGCNDFLPVVKTVLIHNLHKGAVIDV
ncbi:E3 ubiquitin-protein ligase RHF2A [Heracleum sosnowskyi]|uniref:RING-type E3 ubiquitin transferase n=1 Tax=Heracleum sosnowskyi TaxID=360622 RepID=A0AAD8J9L4_9APIA|nr:E3 ubiquitin-protein ligase RHF2A [Heracleum sosnowskyi]